jgi:hypothetical protein
VSWSTAEPDRAVEPSWVTPAWIGGVVLAGIGAGLAVIALTLPWIVVEIRTGNPTTLSVTSMAGQGPVFAVLLVVTALFAAVGLAVARRADTMIAMFALQVGAVLLGAGPAVATLFVGLRPNTAALRAALPATDLAVWDRLTAGAEDLPVSPTSGLTLFVAGLLLIGLGVSIASLLFTGRIMIASGAEAVAVVSARRRALVRWTAVVAAVPLVVLSLALAWFEVDTDGEIPAVAQDWHTVYRVGLAATLLAMVGTALTVGGAQSLLRAVGLYLGGGLLAVLSINALLFWDPTRLTRHFSVELDYLRLGPAYLAAIASVPLLLVVLATSIPAALVTAPPAGNSDDQDKTDEQAGEPA